MLDQVLYPWFCIEWLVFANKQRCITLWFFRVIQLAHVEAGEEKTEKKKKRDKRRQEEKVS